MGRHCEDLCREEITYFGFKIARSLRFPAVTADQVSLEVTMPYVNIKITNEGATAEQKTQLIQGVTKLLQDVLGKNPQTTCVVIEEVSTDNWGIGGETITVRRKRERNQ
jgi:4-oxalocrotonate tautomerase